MSAEELRLFSVVLIPDPEEGGYTVKVPALPGLTTEGDTEAEALANAREAISLYVEVLKERGEPIPQEKDTPRVVTLKVDVAA